MAVYTEELATDISFPHIEVYRKYRDGEHYGYRIVPEEGYLMYDTAANDTDYDPETGTEVPVTRYYHVIHASLMFDFDNFTWVAILESEVDEDHINNNGDDEVATASDYQDALREMGVKV